MSLEDAMLRAVLRQRGLSQHQINEIIERTKSGERADDVIEFVSARDSKTPSSH